MSATQTKIYQVCDFIDRTLPKRGATGDLFTHRILALLKMFSALQEENAFVTINIQTGGAFNLYYRGEILFQLKPQMSYLRLIIASKPKTEEKGDLFALISASKKLFQEDISSVEGYKQWRVREPEIERLERFVRNLPDYSPNETIRDVSHPRNFPGEVRQAALDDFIRRGRKCEGVGRKRHTVDKTERIEFDHVLPHAKGGANSIQNCQVLCIECNRRKRDSAR